LPGLMPVDKQISPCDLPIARSSPPARVRVLAF
jgi:hypothetical protein